MPNHFVKSSTKCNVISLHVDLDLACRGNDLGLLSKPTASPAAGHDPPFTMPHLRGLLLLLLAASATAQQTSAATVRVSLSIDAANKTHRVRPLDMGCHR